MTLTHDDPGASTRRLRAVVTKVGLDGHDRGAKVIAQGFRDAGMEVIYAGLRQTPEQIARTVLQEDADVLGLSILSGSVVPLTRRVMAALKESGIDDVLVLVGGIASGDAAEELRALGVAQVYGPGTKIRDVTDFVFEWARGNER